VIVRGEIGTRLDDVVRGIPSDDDPGDGAPGGIVPVAVRGVDAIGGDVESRRVTRTG